MGVICLNDEELEKRLRFVQFGKYNLIDLSDSLSMTALDSLHISHTCTQLLGWYPVHLTATWLTGD